MPSMGLQEWVFLFIIVLIIFGPSSLPKVGRALGKGIREFKDAVSGIGSTIEQEDAEKKKQEHGGITPIARSGDEKENPSHAGQG
ncbi:MAG: Sec-independent protein translocase subunit TatA/TatB [Candidatus Sumerlaeaceae bacterium]|jgi:sec-independent protein translocase protein TatA